MSERTVLADRHGHVLTLTINRPARRNALTFETLGSLRDHFRAVRSDRGIRVIVLTGAGDKAFCAGADLGGIRGAELDTVAAHEGRGQMADLFQEMWRCGVPTIARVRGYALAGGFGLALACDFVVATDDSVFGAPESAVGLWPYMITVPLLRSMPPKVALDLMVTARRVDATEALRIGFVNQVVGAADLDDTVRDLAQRIAANSPQAIRLGRSAFYRALDMSAEQALSLLHTSLSVATSTEDALEGTTAFAEKRPPVWTDGAQ